jgi:hypothetical protein
MRIPTTAEGPAVQRLFGIVKALHYMQGKDEEFVYERGERPTTPEALHTYMRETWGIYIPDVAVCPGHVSPFTAFCAAYFAEAPIMVWLASRGFGGKSAMLAALGLAEAATMGAGVTILGGSGEQSRRVHAYMEGTDSNLDRSYWNSVNAPRHLLRTSLAVWRTSLKNGGWVHALAASQRSVRGPHPQRMRMDEVDEMDLKLFDASMGQPMSAKGVASQTVCSSTHHNPDGTMTEILKRARAGDWPIYEWCYKESMAGEYGWLTQQAVDEKRSVITQVMWETEYELQEPSHEGRVFDKDCVEKMFDPSLGEPAGGEGEIYVWEKPTWEIDPDWPAMPAWASRFQGDLQDMGKLRGSRRWRKQTLTEVERREWDKYRKAQREVWRRITSRYAAGADWGKEADHTIIWIMRIDCKPWRMVAYANLVRQPYPKMFAQFNDFVARFRAQSAHDATGIGKAAEDYMETSVIDLSMVGQARKELFNDYILVVEGGDVVSPRVKYAFDEHRYCTQDDLWGKGHPPDSVVAGAMAVHAANYGGDLVR